MNSIGGTHLKKVTSKKTEHGGQREGSGRRKLRTKKSGHTFKMTAQAMHSLNRFAKARGVSRGIALGIIIAEHEATLNKEPRVFTWTGEQELLAKDI